MPTSDSNPSDGPQTEWSVVLRARAWSESLSTASRERADESLRMLCEKYNHPVYCYVRAKGFSEHEAEDLVNGFFSDLLSHDRAWQNLMRKAEPGDGGSFRSFLFTSLNSFISAQRRSRAALKRGGGALTYSLDAMTAEQRYRHEPAAADAFDAIWVRELVAQAIEQTRKGYDEQRFNALKPFLCGHGPSFAETADRLGMTAEGVKQAVKRLRAAFTGCFERLIAETVEHPDQIVLEWQHLKGVLDKIEIP